MPNIWQMLNQKQQIQIDRLRKVMRNGSPRYHYDVPAIAIAPAFVEWNCNDQFPASVRYAPLDSMIVINNSASDISVRVNGAGGDTFIVPARTIRNISREDVAAIGNVRITNLVAVAILVDTIDIDVWRQPEDADSIARINL